MSRFSRGIVAIGSFVALTLGMSPVQAIEPNLNHEVLCSPEDPDFFHLNIDNGYLPLLPGQLSVFLDDSDPSEPVGLRIEVLKKTQGIYKGRDRIITRVVKETEWVDFDLDGNLDKGEDLIEISYNYLAQTEDGTVCYFGEAVDIFEDDGVVHDGSWRADEDGNAPGIMMPADPEIGDVYLQEDAPEVAKDLARITHFSTVGPYRHAMHTEECNLAEDPDCEDIGTKVYALDRGIVVDGDLELTKFVAGK